MAKNSEEIRRSICLSADQMALLGGILNYYPRRQGSCVDFHADEEFATRIEAFLNSASPYTQKTYDLSLSLSEAQKLSEAIFEYEWQDEAWGARSSKERAALLDLEERIERFLK